MIKRIKEMWNDGIERGFTMFQWFLIVGMAVGAFRDDKLLLFGCLFVCILGFFEPVKKDDAIVEVDE